MMMFYFSVLDLFCKFCPKHPFGILMLPDSSPSSLFAETSILRIEFILVIFYRYKERTIFEHFDVYWWQSVHCCLLVKDVIF